jgi:transcriptional regulator with XRE-family HTH domain
MCFIGVVMDEEQNSNAIKSTSDFSQPGNSRKPTLFNTPSKQEQAILSREVGLRMKESRVMSGLSQVDAAKRLGYHNSTKLSKIEKGQSTRIPLWVIRKAAIIYDVSCDYLFGVTQTMERDDVSHASLRELHAFMFADFDKRHAQDVAVMMAIRSKLENIERTIVLAAMQADQLHEAKLFVEEQEEWLDVKGGNRLVNYIDRLNHTITSSALRFKDIKKEMQVKSGTEYQMNLLLEV